MMPKGGVTTNDPLDQRPPPPPVPNAHVVAPREGLAFGDLEPLPIAGAQPQTPTTPVEPPTTIYVAGREAELSISIKKPEKP